MKKKPTPKRGRPALPLGDRAKQVAVRLTRAEARELKALAAREGLSQGRLIARDLNLTR